MKCQQHCFLQINRWFHHFVIPPLLLVSLTTKVWCWRVITGILTPRNFFFFFFCIGNAISDFNVYSIRCLMKTFFKREVWRSLMWSDPSRRNFKHLCAVVAAVVNWLYSYVYANRWIRICLQVQKGWKMIAKKKTITRTTWLKCISEAMMPETVSLWKETVAHIHLRRNGKGRPPSFKASAMLLDIRSSIVILC